MTPLVLVTSRSFSSGDVDARGRLESAGVRVAVGPADHDLEDLKPLLAEAVAWIAGAGPVTATHLESAPRLRLVARYGVGVDAVDLAAAERRGITVTNTPGANSGAVADHAVALMLTALRHVTAGDRAVRRGDWQVRRTRELGRLTVGIVGVGRIGRGVAARLTGFGSTVLGHDPWLEDDLLRHAGITPVPLEELAARSDVVSLHAPGEATVVDEAWLSLVKPGLILVNTARATLVDESALAAALAGGRVQTYATDTLSTEPGAGAGANPLLAPELVEQTIFTPHSAAQTVEAVDQMSSGATDAVLALLQGRTPRHVVPAPVSSTSAAGCAKPTSKESH